MTGNDLAAMLKTSAANISRIRTGRQQPRKPLREAIEGRLGLEIGELEVDPSTLPNEPLRLDQLERTVIEAMRMLPQHQRELVRAYVLGMAGNPSGG